MRDGLALGARAAGLVRRPAPALDVGDRNQRPIRVSGHGGAYAYDGESVKALLKTERFGRNLLFFDVVGSTQEKALELASAGAAEGTVVLADEQTSGVGRRGRRWHSARGMGIWLSMILRPRISPSSGGLLSAWAGLAVLDTLRGRVRDPGASGLKWPNDVLVAGRKICGVLIDAGSVGGDMSYAVMGVGLNTGQSPRDFPDELALAATSVKMATGEAPNRAEVVSDLLLKMEKTYPLLADAAGRAELAARAGQESVLTGSPVKVVTGGRTLEGTALRIEANGALVVADARTGAEVAVVAGDVQIVRGREVEL